LNWLGGAGLPIARPVPSYRGNFVETVTTDSGTFNACVFPALPGTQREIEQLDPAGFRSWGAALGRLHAAVHSYPHARSSARPSWQHRLEVQGGPVRRERDHVLAELAQIPVTNGNYGLVHADFELDNLFWNGEVSGIVDFDECRRDWYAADIASALRDRFVGGFDPHDEALRAFVDGYRRHFELDDEAVACVPTFLRRDALATYGTLARALDLNADEDYPVWLLALSRKLEGRMDMYRRELREPSGPSRT
jgi:Ser/Thr protein kinase RdoA (MazF antagonist)